MANAEGDGLTDNWEDLEDSGELDRRLRDIQPEKKNRNKMVNPAPVRVQEEGTRTQYTPTVKILKRQPDNSNNNAVRPLPAKPTLTLEEREAKYAEARMRIFGTPDSSIEKDEPPSSDGSPTRAVRNATGDSRPGKLIQQIDELKVSNNVTRLPKGPDGSKGFDAKR